jgi:hypothetical protein
MIESVIMSKKNYNYCIAETLGYCKNKFSGILSNETSIQNLYTFSVVLLILNNLPFLFKYLLAF